MILILLFLRSRRAGEGIAAVAAVVAGTWIWGRLGPAPDLLLIGAPLAVAVLIGSSTAPPFAELEATIGRRLPLLRLLHAGGTLLLGTLTLFLADHTWVLSRNAIGFTGLALLSSRFLGAGMAWVVPFAYSALAVLSDPGTLWNWPRQAAGDHFSAILALALATAGLALISWDGAHHTAGADS